LVSIIKGLILRAIQVILHPDRIIPIIPLLNLLHHIIVNAGSVLDGLVLEAFALVDALLGVIPEPLQQVAQERYLVLHSVYLYNLAFSVLLLVLIDLQLSQFDVLLHLI